MDAQEISEGIKEAGAYRKEAEGDYKQNINKFSFSLLVEINSGADERT